MQDFIQTFHIDWRLMIAQMINFGLVFAALYFLAAKPLTKLIKDRTEEITTGLDDAKKNKALLEKANEEYQAHTVKLRQMAAEAEKNLQKDLEQMRKENLEKIKTDNDEWAKSRAKQMEADKKTLVEGAKAELASLVILATEKVLDDKNKQNK